MALGSALCQLERTDVKLKKNENFSLVSKVNFLRYKEIDFIWDQESSNSKKRTRFLGVSDCLYQVSQSGQLGRLG